MLAWSYWRRWAIWALWWAPSNPLAAPRRAMVLAQERAVRCLLCQAGSLKLLKLSVAASCSALRLLGVGPPIARAPRVLPRDLVLSSSLV